MSFNVETLCDRPVLADAPTRANIMQPINYQSKKRKVIQEHNDKFNHEHDPDHLEPLDIDLDGAGIDMTCNQVRGKIRRLLDSGAVTKTAFCKEIGVSPNSLNGFLGHTGSMQGDLSDSYAAAWNYFKTRQLAGVKLPAKKAAKTSANSTASTKDVPADISAIHIPGEETDSIPIHDTCDELRKKINAHLAKPAITQAQFARDLTAQVHVRASKVSAKQVTDFRSKKGPTAGNQQIVYYAAYVYFEKLRIQEGKAKSKHRVEMEKRWPEGVMTDRPANRVWCRADNRPWQNQYGRMEFGSR